MDLVDRRRVRDFLVVAGADLGIGDLAGDFGLRLGAVQRALAQEFDAALEIRRLVDALGAGLRGEQPDVDDRRHGGAAALLGRQPRKLLVEIGERQRRDRPR